MASVTDYADYFGLRALPVQYHKGGPRFLITAAKGYRFVDGWRDAYCETAHDAKQAVNVLMNVHQVCAHCETPRKGSYGNVRDA